MSETLLMATRHGQDQAEAEPVLVERDGRVVRLRLDDGDMIEFDAVEFDAALERAA